MKQFDAKQMVFYTRRAKSNYLVYWAHGNQAMRMEDIKPKEASQEILRSILSVGDRLMQKL
jgi:hypothetical protein